MMADQCKWNAYVKFTDSGFTCRIPVMSFSEKGAEIKAKKKLTEIYTADALRRLGAYTVEARKIKE